MSNQEKLTEFREIFTGEGCLSYEGDTEEIMDYFTQALTQKDEERRKGLKRLAATVRGMIMSEHRTLCDVNGLHEVVSHIQSLIGDVTETV